MASPNDGSSPLGSALPCLLAAVELGTRATDAGHPDGACALYTCAARLARRMTGLGEVVDFRLDRALNEAESLADPSVRAAALRDAFESLLPDVVPAPVPDDPLAAAQRFIELAISIGAPAYNLGDHQGCYDVYFCTARMILTNQTGTSASLARLLDAIAECVELDDPDKQAWAMRHGFDAVLEMAAPSGSPLEADEDRLLLTMAIRIGASAFNLGDTRGCYEVYACTARLLVHSDNVADEVKARLRKALEEASVVPDGSKQAWTLRHAFDAILTGESTETPVAKPKPSNPSLELILSGNAPEGMSVDGLLRFQKEEGLVALPAGLTARRLSLRECVNLRELPKGLRVRSLEIFDCPQITSLPSGLHCHELIAENSNLAACPEDLRVDYRLDLSGSAQVTSLPADLKVGALELRGCTALTGLPEGLDVCFLDLTGCVRLTRWPRNLRLSIGRLNLSGCRLIRELPAGLTEVAQLNISDCPLIRELPANLEVRSWIDVGGSGLTALPPKLADTPIRWRGVFVNERIAFRPETLRIDEILAEANAEVRRVMIERVGFDWFVHHAKAEELDRDRDPGGERRLLRIPLENDEPIVCVSVLCPSTGRQYILRVPPTMTTCKSAVAWTAGFEDPSDYRPRIET